MLFLCILHLILHSSAANIQGNVDHVRFLQSTWYFQSIYLDQHFLCSLTVLFWAENSSLIYWKVPEGEKIKKETKLEVGGFVQCQRVSVLDWVCSVKFTGTLCQQLFERHIGSEYTPFLTVNKEEISCHKVSHHLGRSDSLDSSLTGGNCLCLQT